jgi:hypothetical protein
MNLKMRCVCVCVLASCRPCGSRKATGFRLSRGRTEKVLRLVLGREELSLHSVRANMHCFAGFVVSILACEWELRDPVGWQDRWICAHMT